MVGEFEKFAHLSWKSELFLVEFDFIAVISTQPKSPSSLPILFVLFLELTLFPSFCFFDGYFLSFCFSSHLYGVGILLNILRIVKGVSVNSQYGKKP